MSYPYQIKSVQHYHEQYQKSINDPASFWSEIANNFVWHKKWDQVLNWNFNEPKVEWFAGGKLNITENCLDRWAETQPDVAAIIWEPNEPSEKTRTITYKDLLLHVCQFAQVLKTMVQKRRSNMYLHAYDSGANHRSFGMCQNWSNTFCCVWWIFCTKHF